MRAADRLRDVIVVGSGPAGYTAAIYAAPAGLGTLVVEGVTPGGALMSAGLVENYPGIGPSVRGPALVAAMRDQAWSHVGADAAVLMMRRVQITFVAAGLTRNRACLQHRLGDGCVVCRVTRQYAARSHADVGAVKVCANAFREMREPLLAMVGVRARRAGLSALYADFDTSDQFGAVPG